MAQQSIHLIGRESSMGFSTAAVFFWRPRVPPPGSRSRIRFTVSIQPSRVLVCAKIRSRV